MLRRTLVEFIRLPATSVAEIVKPDLSPDSALLSLANAGEMNRMSAAEIANATKLVFLCGGLHEVEVLN